MTKTIKTTEARVKKVLTRVFITGFVMGISTGVGVAVAIPKLHNAYVANHHYGHYEAEYQYDNGVLHDINGDGDYYKWVWDCTPYCNGNHNH